MPLKKKIKKKKINDHLSSVFFFFGTQENCQEILRNNF